MTLSADDITLLEGVQDRGATNAELALACWLLPTVALEQAIQQVLTLRNVNTATGVTLDLIGKLVGRAREGVADDDVYRRYVRAQIVANRSHGAIDTILRVASLVVYDDAATFAIDNVGAAAYVLIVDDVALALPVAQALTRLVRKATAAHVRALVAWTDDPVTALRWDRTDWDDFAWWYTADRSF